MRALFRSDESQPHAITDLYDPERGSFLVQYPVWIVVALALAGIVTFVLVGFLGFRDQAAQLAGSQYFEPAFSRIIFHQAWPLYLWFCALIMALQISILRHPSLRRQLVATLIVTVISIILVGVIYYYNVAITNFLQNLLQYIFGRHILIKLLGDSPWTYAFINLLIIVLFWVDTLRRWSRRMRGLPPATHIDIDLTTGRVNRTVSTKDMPSMQELVSGDLIAGAVLVLVLSLIFHAEVINAFSNLLNIGVSVNTCTVSWPLGACHGTGLAAGGGFHDPPTLSFIDLIQTLIYLPIGLIILAVSATLSGLGAVGGVNDAKDVLNPVPAGEQDETSTESVSEQVSLTVINTLRSALNRRLRLAINNAAMSLRTAVWPLLILLGVIGVAAAARDIQFYLHLLSDQRTCTSAASCPDYSIVHAQLSSGQQYLNVAGAALWGIVAVLSIVFSVTLLIFKWRVAQNTFGFLRLVGFIVLLTFWIFSLALSAFNGLFSLTHLSNRVPFPQPGFTTIISLVALIIAGVIYGVRRVRGPRPPQPAKIPTPVGTKQRS